MEMPQDTMPQGACMELADFARHKWRIMTCVRVLVPSTRPQRCPQRVPTKPQPVQCCAGDGRFSFVAAAGPLSGAHSTPPKDHGIAWHSCHSALVGMPFGGDWLGWADEACGVGASRRPRPRVPTPGGEGEGGGNGARGGEALSARTCLARPLLLYTSRPYWGQIAPHNLLFVV